MTCILKSVIHLTFNYNAHNMRSITCYPIKKVMYVRNEEMRMLMMMLFSFFKKNFVRKQIQARLAEACASLLSFLWMKH